jgi:hypothetical protein
MPKTGEAGEALLAKPALHYFKKIYFKKLPQKHLAF